MFNNNNIICIYIIYIIEVKRYIFIFVYSKHIIIIFMNIPEISQTK